jgi:hypothetical protein
MKIKANKKISTTPRGRIDRKRYFKSITDAFVDQPLFYVWPSFPATLFAIGAEHDVNHFSDRVNRGKLNA